MSNQPFYRRKSNSSLAEAFKTVAHTVLWGALGLLLLAGIYAGWRAAHNPWMLPIQQVVVEAGDLHVSQADLQRLIYENLEGNLLSLNELRLKKGLLQLPWVENVSIRRVWPGKLIVKMAEQTPVARWGHSQLLNRDLELFSPPIDTFPSNVPSLFGPAKSEHTLWKQYQILNQRFAPLKLQVISLQLSPRRSWSFLLSNDVEVIWGREDLEPRLERLVRLYPKLIAERPDSLALIDLRYPNGLAIKWKDEKPSPTH